MSVAAPHLTVPAEALQRLNETIRRAARLSPYYREAFAGVDLNFDSLDGLRRIPLLSRELLISRAFDMLAEGSVPVTVSMSGGTTSAQGGGFRQVMFFRGEEESRARREATQRAYGSLGVRPLILHLMNLGHGYDPSFGLEGVFQMPLERPFHFEAILSLIRHEFSFPGYTPQIMAIVSALRMLKALTLLSIERGIDGSELGIALLSSSSNHLTSRWRRILGEYWQAQIDETYGISEVAGLHARRCAKCGHFHFGPDVVVEVLAVDSDEPVVTGVGRMVATSLYPLAAIQPIIRYDTEDLVEVFDDCAARGTFGFEFVGRRKNAVIAPGADGSRVLLSPITVNEVLDGIPDIATQQFVFADLLGLRSQGVGYQKWSVLQRPEERRVELAVELKWSPTQFRPAAGDLRERLRSLVLDAAPALADAVGGGEVGFDVTLHEPGSTDLKALV